MTKRFQFRHVNELTGLFVLVLLAGAVAALVLAARSQHWFAATTEFRLQLPPSGASGLKPGNEVVLLGLSAGLVKDVSVDAEGRLDAHISLRRDLAQFIRADSQATIKKVFGVAGDSFVELTRGSTGEPLPAGAVIRCQSSEELPSVMDRLVNEVRDEIVPIARKTSMFLDEWVRVGTNLNARLAQLEETLVRINRLAANLEAGGGTLGRLLTDTNLVTQGERALEQAQAALADLQTLMKQLKEGTARLPEISENLRQGTERLPAITQAVEAETHDLPGLVLQVHQTAAELERLIQAMQRHWLLRKYVEPPASDGRIPPERIEGGVP